MSIFTIAFIGMLLFVLLMGIGMTLMLRTAVNWSKELLELEQYGVEATGRVIEKRQTSRRGSTTRWIRYEYVDQFGQTHRSRRNIVTPEAWDSHPDGGPLAVVHSQRRPRISLPKYLMDRQPTKYTRGGRS